MPAKKAAKKAAQRLTGRTVVPHDDNPPPVLVPHERQWLREVIGDPKFQKALDVINQAKPGLFPADNFGPTVELKRYNKEQRINEIRGWEQYNARLLTVANEPQAKKEYQELPEPTYGIIEDE